MAIVILINIHLNQLKWLNMCRITPNAAKFEFVNSLKIYVYCIKRHVKTIKIYYNLIYMIFYYINIKILLNSYILNNFFILSV